MSTFPLVDLATLVADVLDDLTLLHAIKQRAYKASWRRHGEYLSIFANLARKADRLEDGVATPDESPIDTLADLATYAILYTGWLQKRSDTPDEGFDAAAQFVEANARAMISMSHVPINLRETLAPYRTLERVILDEIADPASARPALKLELAVRLAACCALTLAHIAQTDPYSYTLWANQWRSLED